MQSPGRLVAPLCMTILTLLALGALALSLATSTSPTDVQLNAAAQTTAGASSFQEDVRIVTRSLPPGRLAYRVPRLTPVAAITYEAPDRIAIVERNISSPSSPLLYLIVVGATAWESEDGGRSWQTQPAVTVFDGNPPTRVALGLPTELASVRGASSSGGTYTVQTAQTGIYLSTGLASEIPAHLHTYVTASLSAGHLATVRTFFTTPTQELVAEFHYFKFGRAPAIHPPTS